MHFVYRLLDLEVRGSHLLDLLSHLVHELYNITTKIKYNTNTKHNTPLKILKHPILTLLD
jgi:hypothetical protein